MGFFGSVFSLPQMGIFYAVWICSSLTRPLLLATVVCLAINVKAAKRKLSLFATTFRFLALCKDKKFKKPEDFSQHFTDGDDKDVETKTVVFLRHGESTWNDTFNKGDRKLGQFLLGFIPNLCLAVATEWYFLVSGKYNESWFFDSPLSKKGMDQASSVRKFLAETDPAYSTPKEAHIIQILRGEATEKTRVMSSNLRRAISTVCIGLQDRWDANKNNPKKMKEDKILILTELQEMSFNPDALSIHPAKAPLVDSWMDSERVKEIYQLQCDTSKNAGNKTLTSNGLERMQEFCRIAFEETDAPSIVATGHSFWFRAFFQTYLPHDFVHVSKKKKLINGGICGFTLKRKKVKEDYKYMVDPSSMTVLYGGF